MKKLMFIGGILLLGIAPPLALMALLFPDNGLFTMLWNWGIFTFRGEASLMPIYLTSGLFAVLGVYLLISQAKLELRQLAQSSTHEENV